MTGVQTCALPISFDVIDGKVLLAHPQDQFADGNFLCRAAWCGCQSTRSIKLLQQRRCTVCAAFHSPFYSRQAKCHLRSCGASTTTSAIAFYLSRIKFCPLPFSISACSKVMPSLCRLLSRHSSTERCSKVQKRWYHSSYRTTIKRRLLSLLKSRS